MKKKNIAVMLIVLTIILICLFKVYTKKEVVQVDIGYQSVTTQTWSALIIKNKNLFENKLKEEYKDKKVIVNWHDEISGAVINTNMISGKVQFGFMGDMPLILNMYKSNTIKEYDSKLLALDGTGINGKNQSIVVPVNSKVSSVEDLKGKTISTPIGSSAHYMLMKVLERHNLLDDVEIVHQDVALASQLLSTNKTDAFSIWAPYPNFLVESKNAKELISGEDSEIDYLAGIMVDNKWAKENKRIVDLFLESLDEAHKFINDNPKEAAKIFSIESGFDTKITNKEVSNVEWSSLIEEKDIQTLKDKQEFLIGLDQVKEFNIDDYIYQRK